MEQSNNGIDGHPAAAHLPHDIIFCNILSRIPVKDLHRFRCVCKPWSNLPDDPLFKSSYSHYKSNHQSNNIDGSYNERGFICCKEGYFVGGDENNELTTYCFSFLDIDKKERKQIPFQLPEGKYGNEIRNDGADVSIEDSFNGVLFLRFKLRNAGNQFYVYNPACGCWILSHRDMRNFSYALSDYSLVYDPIISRYKVVGHNSGSFYISTVGEDHTWRHTPKPKKHTRILGKPVNMNYALHWICRSGHILRMDACKEEVSIIKLPIEGSSLPHRLLEMGGLLWFIHSASLANNYQLKLWYLKKNHEWAAKCSINLGSDIRSQQLISCSGGYSWNREPVVIVTDPIFKIIFTFVDKEDCNNRYTYSYDVELKQWDLIHEGPVACFDKKKEYAKDFDEQEFHYWYDNNNALSTYNACQCDSNIIWW